MPHLDRRGMVVAVVLVLVWGSAFAAIRSALEGYSAVHLTAARMLVASAALAVAAPRLGIRRPPARFAGRLALVGLLGVTLYQLLLNLGEVRIPAATASLLIATAPVFTGLLAIAHLGELVTVRRWAGIGLAAVGAVLVSLDDGSGLRFQPAAMLVLAAAVCAAGYTVVQKGLFGVLRPVEVTVWATWFGTLLLLPACWGLPAAVADAGRSANLSVLWLGVFPSALGYLLFAIVLARLDASAAASLLYLIPPVAAVVAWVWLGESLGIVTAIGGMLALVGVWLATRPGSSVGVLSADATT